MNYAGKHLKDLQRKVQSFDFGTILSEGKKRIGSKIGVQSIEAPELVNLSPQLSKSTALAIKAATEFGETVESLLIKYGKRITGKTAD
jgi:hypothetical protein